MFNEVGAALLEAETKHACVSLAEKPRRIPPDLLTRLQPYLHESVEAG
jgi:acyl-CoA thioesterase FadM